MADLIHEYDPNWRWGQQEVEITLMVWGYSATHTVQIGGNCHGLTVLEAAVDELTEQLYKDIPEELSLRVLLTDPEGNTLLCEDDDGRTNEWLKDMVVSLRIVGYEPEQAEAA